jgi:hypothetical protein
LQLWDDDGLFGDDLLHTIPLAVTHPATVWDGLLIPYSTTALLAINASGHVGGNAGDSDEVQAQVYQYIVEGALYSDLKLVP